MKYQQVVGMDIAKDSVQASCFDGTTFFDFSFPNQEKLFLKEVQKRISKSDPSHTLFVMEATGVYHLKLATALDKKGYSVAVVNPFIIKKYAEMLLKRAKTDRNDARLIAQFGFDQEVALFAPKESVAEEITQVLKGLDQLKKERTNLKNYQEALIHHNESNPVVRDLYQKHLKEVKNHHCVGTTFLDGFNIWIPSINGYRLNRVFLLLTQRFKEGFQGFIFSPRFDPKNLASLPVNNDSEIVMSFLHGYFIYCQKTRIFIHRLRKLILKILFMNSFDGFPIQVKMSCYFLDGHHRTEKKKVVSQSFADSFPGINKAQLFNGITTAWTSHLFLSHRKSGLGIKAIEISHHPFVVGMNFFNLVLTMVTYWFIAFIRVDDEIYHLFFLIKGLFDHLDSTKIKEWIKLYLGHRLASSGFGFYDANTISRKASGVHFYFTFLSTIWEKNQKIIISRFSRDYL